MLVVVVECVRRRRRSRRRNKLLADVAVAVGVVVVVFVVVVFFRCRLRRRPTQLVITAIIHQRSRICSNAADYFHVISRGNQRRDSPAVAESIARGSGAINIYFAEARQYGKH